MIIVAIVASVTTMVLPIQGILEGKKVEEWNMVGIIA